VTGWADLDAEIARWQRAGRSVDLWWRDDDAVEATPALERLLAMQQKCNVPLALAVVPARATAGLAERLAVSLARAPGIEVLQHGYAHVNHAAEGDRKIELGAERPAMIVLGDLGTGWLALERLFGGRALPVLVPPWNRIAPGLVPALPEIGFVGLSTFGARPRPHPVRGLVQVNTHVDLIDWKGGRGFVGESAALDQLLRALMRAREREQGVEPVGILSHHLAMDEPGWDYLKSFWDRICATPGVRTLPARGLFASGEARV
jgi:hypothetical protein